MYHRSEFRTITAYRICWQLLISILGVVPVTALAATYSTSFEGLGGGDFTIGESPITATFSNGEVVAAGIPENYRTGDYSWRVFAGVPAIISFETPASEVELYFRNPEGTGPSNVIVYDVNDEILLTVNGTLEFRQVYVSRQAGETLIDRVVINNNTTVDGGGGDPYGGGGGGDGGVSTDIMVDDVTFTAELPEEVDSDNDGVSDRQELENGTNPNVNEAVLLLLNSNE